MSIINFQRSRLMETQTSNQLITSHLKDYPKQDYFVGLDIGTNSVGWAVTNTSYELLKFHSHKMWGSRLFEEGESAVTRRGFRSMRRRLERRKLRLKLLEELFADAMAQVDSTFFIRLHESKYHYEDKTTGHSSNHILFIDEDYTDQDYFTEYPTIYHLRKDLMENGTDDIRKLFLAVHHILKYRGNFLYEGATFNSNAFTFEDVLKQALVNITFNCFDTNSAISSISNILMESGKTKSDKAKAIERLVDTYTVFDEVNTPDKPQKEQVKEDKKTLKAFANLVLGLSANLIDLFGSVEDIDDDLKKLQIVGDTYDEKRDELAKVWGDEIHIIDDCKSVYDAIILMSIKDPGLTISQSKVKAFDKHKEDLVILKSLLKLDRNVYNEMFKSDKKGLHNYVHYIKQGRTEETSCSREDFYKYTKKIVEGLADSKEKEYILNEIELQTLLPLQRIRKEDGATVKPGDVPMVVSGKIRSLLQTERLMLNVMQRMSGIATMTREYVRQLEGTHAKVLDTRKTTPGLRMLEKEAVRIGGGVNHRIGLFDMILLKDNHVDFCGGIDQALNRCEAYQREKGLHLKVEIEVRSEDEIRQVMSNGKADRIMLDNFSVEATEKAVKLIDGKFETESSGGITLQTIRSYALCGVDYISVGALTHSVKGLDMSFKAID